LLWNRRYSYSYNYCPDVCKKNLFVSAYSFNPLNAELNPICHLLALLGSHPIFHVSRIRVKQILFSLHWDILVDMRTNFWKAVNISLNMNTKPIDINKCCSFLLLISVCLQVTGSLYVQSQVYMTNYMSDLKQNYVIFQGYNKGKWRIGTYLLLCTQFPKCDGSNREAFIKWDSQWSVQPG